MPSPSLIQPELVERVRLEQRRVLELAAALEHELRYGEGGAVDSAARLHVMLRSCTGLVDALLEAVAPDEGGGRGPGAGAAEE